MSERFESIIKAMEGFLSDPRQQTLERAQAIAADPLYRELVRSLSPREFARHPIIMRFLRTYNALLRRALVDRIRRAIDESGKGR